jgi:hypothetical protein
MTTRGSLTNINIPDWMFKALLSILAFMLIYMLNQKSTDIIKLSEENKEMNKKLDQIIQQNGDVQGDLKLVNSKLSDFDIRFGDHERRIRELELKEARRER